METIYEKQKKVATPTFAVQQAIIAMQMKKDETKFLKYIHAWQQQIPTFQSLFLHILPVPNLFSVMYEEEAKMLISNFSLTGAIKDEMEQRVKQQFDEGSFAHLDFKVKEGNPLEDLMAEVKESDADLVFIGQSPKKDFHGILAKNLARKITCNALVVPDQSKPKLIQKILVPIDLSPTSMEVVCIAIAIQQQLKTPCELVFLNIYELPYSNYSFLRSNSKEINEAFKKDRELAFHHYIHTYLPKNEPFVQTKLVEKGFSSIGKYIHEYAENEDFDLIIMGAKGHSKVEVLLMGSVSEKVLSLSKNVPMLLVREHSSGRGVS